MLMNQDSVRARINTLERRVPQAVRGAADVLRQEMNDRFPVFLERLESVLEHFSADAHCSIAQAQLFAAQADFFLNQQSFRLVLDEQILASFVSGDANQEITLSKFAWLASPFTPYEYSELAESLGQWVSTHGVVRCNPFSPDALQQQMAMSLGMVLNEPRTALLIMEEYRQWLSRELPSVLLSVRELLQAHGVEFQLSDVMLNPVDSKTTQSRVDVYLSQLEDFLEKNTLHDVREDFITQIMDALSANENDLAPVAERIQQVFSQQKAQFWLHNCQKNTFLLLQIPAIKFAVNGHDFTHQDTHLFRRLMTLVSEIGYGSPASALDDPQSDICRSLHKSVLQVMRCRDNDPACLIVAVDELLRVFSDARIGVAPITDKHSLNTLQAIGSSRDMIRHARTMVDDAHGVSDKIHADALLLSLRELIHAWHNVMLKTLLDHGEKSDEWAVVSATLNQMVLSAQASEEDVRQQSMHSIPDLIRTLRLGLEKQYSTLETSRVLDGFEALYLQLAHGESHSVAAVQISIAQSISRVFSAAVPGQPGEWFHTVDNPGGIWQLLGSSTDGVIHARGIDGALVEFSAAATIDFLPQQDNIYRALR